MNDQWLVEQALAFSAEHGVPVLPCRQDKSPATKHGFKDASDDPETIEKLFSHPEAAFVAMPSGPTSGISVLDIDVAKDDDPASGFDWLDANRGLIPQTRTAQTPSGGLHYYFRHVEGLRCSNSKVAQRVDVKGKGGLIIVAGLGYELITDIPFTELPQFPAEVIAQLGSDTKKEPGEPCRAHDLSKIHASGHWHDITRDWVAAAVSRGDSKKTILELAPLFQMPGYSLSKTEEELTSFFDSAIDKGWAPLTYLQSNTPSSDEEQKSFLEKLQAWSSTGNSQVMIQKLLEDKFVLEEMAILGEWTTIYASHNVGKTLLTLRLLIDSVKSGNLDGRSVFYINADDSYKGSVEKLSIAEKYGIEMLLPNQNNFIPGTFVEELGQAARNNEAREIVVILDTLKKFTDPMNKTESTHFGKIAREFVQAGGTIIGLAHTNKHPDESGKKIYSGTTDIADDCDCYHIIELIEDNKASGRRVIQSRCDKPRGAVALEKTFYYVRKQETSYEDLLNSFSVMDQETARQEKRSIKKKRQYYEDKRVIDSIIGFASQEEVELTELIKKVASDTQIGRGKCRDVVERYKGELLDEFTFWKILKGPHNRKTLEILSWDLGQPKN